MVSCELAALGEQSWDYLLLTFPEDFLNRVG